MVTIDYLEYSDSESDIEDVLDLDQLTLSNKLGGMKSLPSKLRRAITERKLGEWRVPHFQRTTSLYPPITSRKRISNNIRNAFRTKRKRIRPVWWIPKHCAKSWAKNYTSELDRYMRLTSGECNSEFWDNRLRMDLQRASRVVVNGIVEESFIFSQHESMDIRGDLVEVFLKFLQASIKEVISDNFSLLSEQGYAILAQKAVFQGVVALCQDFTNEPYFRLLKNACEHCGLTPLSNNGYINKGDIIIGSDGQQWKTDITVTITNSEMVMEVKRTFSTVWVTNAEILPAEYILGFKRRYSVDLLGGPPRIYPSVWMGHGYDKTREVCCKQGSSEFGRVKKS